MTTTRTYYGSKPLGAYLNGNVRVTLWSNGTKIRTCDGQPRPEFPESIDVKITNKCTRGCAFCHENSVPNGDHGDLDTLLQKLEPLPAGIELAIGGGNPLEHPKLIEFLTECKARGWICNLTVHQDHLSSHGEVLAQLLPEDYDDESRLIYGLGVSVSDAERIQRILRSRSWDTEVINDVEQLALHYDNTVFHVVAGVHSMDDILTVTKRSDELSWYSGKILILGYKDFGRGVKYHDSEVDEKITSLRRSLFETPEGITLAFDNLAIEQLRPQRMVTQHYWDLHFNGNDFEFSMYVDAVRGEFARTSRSPYEERVSWGECGIFEFFTQD